MEPTIARPLGSRRATRRLGEAIARAFSPGDLVLLEGPLGSGKTFLARAIARALGARGPVTSPTFTLVREIATPRGVLLHGDLYRLRGAAPQRVHPNHVAAAHMREERSDGDDLRRYRHIDRAALDELCVGRLVDQGHDLVRA